jgi:hypothetical protein
MKRSDARSPRLAAAALSALALAATATATATVAQAQALSAAMAPLGFLIGTWNGVDGRTADGGEPRGSFTIEPAAGGAALLRRDHGQVFRPDGALVLTLDQVMLIYPEGGGLRADYFDGTHVIHYAKAEVEPCQSVRFTSAVQTGAPTYSLTLRRLGNDEVTVRFEVAGPGQSAFHLIAAGTARRG